MSGSYVVNFIASPGTGKTLMAALTFAALKCEHNTCELVQEFAKELVWKEEYETLNNQWYVSENQYKRLKSVYKKVKFVVTDSPLFLGVYYNRNYPDNVCNVEKTEKMILQKIKEFNNIYIFLKKNEEFPFENIGRVHNEQQSLKIQNDLKEILEEFGISFLEVKSDANAVGDIVKYIHDSASLLKKN